MLQVCLILHIASYIISQKIKRSDRIGFLTIKLVHAPSDIYSSFSHRVL